MLILFMFIVLMWVMLAIEGFGGPRVWNKEGLSLMLNSIFKRHAGYKAAEVDQAYVTLTQVESILRESSTWTTVYQLIL